ncbi:hypothetical protein MUGA111182_14610 [Mucilaginibacter galii]
MAKVRDLNDPAGINAYINKLGAPLARLVEATRQVILNTDPITGERIKWNSPSFFTRALCSLSILKNTSAIWWLCTCIEKPISYWFFQPGQPLMTPRVF